MELIGFIGFGIVVSYLLGSIPTAVWYGKTFHNIDVRNYGSGNAGATNTFRVLGKKAGTIVMTVDILKGWIATCGVYVYEHYKVIPTEDAIPYQIAFGIAAVIGHIFPVYERFKGGKGVATLLGTVLAIHIQAALLCVLVFLIVFIISKYVSLGSLIAALSFPIILLLPRFYPHEPLLIVFGFVIFFVVVITHQKNIVRLLHGEENKTRIRLRKKELPR